MSHRDTRGHDGPNPNLDPNLQSWTPPPFITLDTPASFNDLPITPTIQSPNQNMLPPNNSYIPLAQNSTDQGNPQGSKVAIPRIAPPHVPHGRRRSARACEPCRQRKVKCDGLKPACGQCTHNNHQCYYEDVKRVRDQRELKLLWHRVDRYEHLLRSLEAESEAHTARRIRKTLKSPMESHHLTSRPPLQFKDGKRPSAQDADDSDSSIGSLEDIDNVNEDLDRDENTRAAGYYGKNSEVSWMQRLEDNVERESSMSLSPITPTYSNSAAASNRKPSRNIPISMMNYHLDDLDIPPLDDSDPYIVPPRAVADEYLNTYFTFVHPSFPAIRRPTYVSRYRQFYDRPSRPPRKWLGILNMVLAIGCHYSKLTYPDNDSSEDDSVYFARARKLIFDENVLFDHADLQQIQVEFLVALYLLCLGQINRASKFSSMALRSALSLGINLRNKDDRIHDASKEARIRLWWSIYSLEHLLTSMHGRASCVGESLCSVPLGMPIEEESFEAPEVQQFLQNATYRENQLRPTLLETDSHRRELPSWIASCEPSPSLFFYHLIDLFLISQAVFNKVYSIEGIRGGASQIEYRIQSYGRRMDRWRSRLNHNYQFTLPDAGPWHINPNLEDESLPYTRERVCLAMNYYSARITLSRPCLTQAPSPSANLPQHSQAEPSSHSRLRAEMATNCLQAACSLLSILPDTPSLAWLARSTPWWSFLHFLMQATTALLLGLSYCSFASPPLNSSLSRASSQTNKAPLLHPHNPLLEADLNIALSEAKKALSWIHTMATVDPAARRAFILCDSVVQKIAPGLRLDLTDWPSAETIPGGDLGMDTTTLDPYDFVDFEGGYGNISYFDGATSYFD